jgi:O-6-methylguanine DNA methyltransferase
MDILCFSENGIDICMEADSGYIERIGFGKGYTDKGPVSGILAETKKQILEYFSGTRKEFSVPVKASGSDFCRKVYDVVNRIPYGKTMTYKEVAAMLGSVNKARAVGNALHGNPLPILTPCHRVVRSNGAAGGFNGGAGIKRILLDLERKCSH